MENWIVNVEFLTEQAVWVICWSWLESGPSWRTADACFCRFLIIVGSYGTGCTVTTVGIFKVTSSTSYNFEDLNKIYSFVVAYQGGVARDEWPLLGPNSSAKEWVGRPNFFCSGLDISQPTKGHSCQKTEHTEKLLDCWVLLNWH